MMNGRRNTFYPIRPGSFVRFKKKDKLGGVAIVEGYVKEDFYQRKGYKSKRKFIHISRTKIKRSGTHYLVIDTGQRLLQIRAGIVYQNIIEHRVGELARLDDLVRAWHSLP